MREEGNEKSMTLGPSSLNSIPQPKFSKSISQALAKLKHSTDVINQCTFALQELEKSHEEANSYLYKATGGVFMNPAARLDASG